MLMAFSRLAARLGSLVLVITCAPITLSADFEARLAPAVFRDEFGFSHTPTDCSGKLFSASSAAVSNPEDVDFCKELLIVDKEVISEMSELSFKQVMQRMLGTSPADTAEIMKAWANTWAGTNVDSPPRRDVSEQVFKAWSDDRIKLIAVVNRLDLALGMPFDHPRNDDSLNLGEGRLVYQLFDTRDAPLSMTLILEFAYAPLDPEKGTKDNLTLWADKWQRLRTESEDANAFRDHLRQLVDKFAVPSQLRRIRTDEALKWVDAAGNVIGNELWAFRQYDFAGCAESANSSNCRPQLIWVALPHTPLDEYAESGNERLNFYLGREGVLSDLIDGIHEFGKRDAPENPILLDKSALIPDSGITWGYPLDVDEARLLMSFNTCNGCHSEFKNDPNVLPHIAVPDGGKEPRLSSFLYISTPLKHELAGCRDVDAWPGCGKGEQGFSWNEQANRVYYYYSHLSTTKAQGKPVLREPKLYYRYH